MDDFIAASALALALLGSAYKIIEAFFGLRAKARLHDRVLHLYGGDAHLRELINKVESEPLDQISIIEATAEIERLCKDLSERDRKFIEDGLSQPSRSGAQRYIKDILTASWS